MDNMSSTLVKNECYKGKTMSTASKEVVGLDIAGHNHGMFQELSAVKFIV
jgi:ribosomal protein L31